MASTQHKHVRLATGRKGTAQRKPAALRQMRDPLGPAHLGLLLHERFYRVEERSVIVQRPVLVRRFSL